MVLIAAGPGLRGVVRDRTSIHATSSAPSPNTAATAASIAREIADDGRVIITSTSPAISAAARPSGATTGTCRICGGPILKYPPDSRSPPYTAR